ncbi:NosD domain-containing protein [Thalassoroseus pseudoceratinae]|uniref:NosD domain-containing protein n=1 Tax=Thalassoroseus pseudoceratinae TaxID=2713176 RepID=UPI0014246217|nr:NosD domain-containing protein [Thalassoroseus pseudoceratinae]
MRKNTYTLIPCLLVISVLTGTMLWPDSTKPIVLSGARTVIDAADYKTLQAALDAVPEEGGLVRLPPGRFELSEPLRIERSDIHIKGAGTSTQLVNTNQDGQPTILVAHPTRKEVAKKDRLWRVQISDLRVVGQEKSGHGILAEFVNEIYLEGVTVSEHGGDGIRLDFCYEDPRVCDCLITYNKKVGLNLIGCHDIVVSANHFEENQDAVRCADGYNLCMNGNNLDDHLRHGVVVENTYGSVVSGNMIEECNGTGIILDRDCYGDTLSANVIAHNGSGIDLKDGHGCAVSANTFTINKDFGLRISPNSGRITVTGNSFSNSYIGDDKVRRAENDLAAGGLILEKTREITITGNGFSSVRPKAIAVTEPTENILVDGNVFTDVEAELNKLSPNATGNNLVSE